MSGGDTSMTPQQAAQYADRGEAIRTGNRGGVIPPATEKATEWNNRWEQRYAPRYYARDDGQRFPKPAVRPAPARVGKANEPQSAEVIRALERHINGGKLFSPEPVE